LILLDTHVWIWWVSKHQELSESERHALDDAAVGGELALAAISLWEVQMLHSDGRLALEQAFEPWLLDAAAPERVRVLPLDVPVVVALQEVPASVHRNLAGRIVAATARAYDLPLATRDHSIRDSGAVRLWSA
jgi:PIN domain nuclease of toxin-antitoxin system